MAIRAIRIGQRFIATKRFFRRFKPGHKLDGKPMYMVRNKTTYCNKCCRRITYISRVVETRCHIKMYNWPTFGFMQRRLKDWAECNRLLVAIEKQDEQEANYPRVGRTFDGSWLPPYFGDPLLN